ncbi:MAG: DMT family transporter [Eubacteriales bacterium]|nr:DMT family transporter [Eubacteriales bacterium]
MVIKLIEPGKTGRQVLTLPYIFLLLQDLLYGFGDPISKMLFDIMPVYAVLVIRYCIALLAMLLIWHKRIFRGLKETPVKVWFLPAFCTGAAYIVNNLALSMTAATNVAFIRSMPTLIAPLLALIVYRKKYKLAHLPIQLLVLVGLYMLCCENGIGSIGPGELFALMAAVMLAGSLVFGEQAVTKMDGISLSAAQTIMSLIMAAGALPLTDPSLHLELMNGSCWLIVLYLAITCTLGGYILQNAALESISSRAAALLQTLTPVITAIFSFILLGERTSVTGIIGAAIILFSVIADQFIGET